MSAPVDWLIAAALLLGALSILALGFYTNAQQCARTVLHGGVCIIAAVFYVAIAMEGQPALGPVEMDTHHLLWLLTTPLLLAALMVTASPTGRTLLPMAATVIFLDVVMVLARAIAADQYGAAVWVWFLVSLAAMGLMFGLLVGPIRDAAHEGHPIRAALYERHARLVVVLWSLWPAVFLLGPDMIGLIGPVMSETLYGGIDVAAMAIYGLVVVLEDERLIALESADQRSGTLYEDGVRDRLAGALAADRGQPQPPGTARRPEALRSVARGRLASLSTRGSEAARTAAAASRLRAIRALRATRADLASLGPRTAPPPPIAPRPQRRKRPSQSSLLDTPFGRLTREDAVPVAMVVGVLLVVAYAGRRRDD